MTSRDSRVLERHIFLKKFEAEMYCQKDIFFEAIDYADKKVDWKTFCEIMCSINDEPYD